MRKGLCAAACAAAVIAVIGSTTASPAAAGKATPPPWGTSFVDLDDDGVRDANDPSLASVLDEGGYSNVDGRVGIVLENVALRQKDAFVHVLVRGNITVRGKYSVRAGGGMISFGTVNGNVTIPDGVSLQSKGDLSFTAYEGAVRIGNNVSIQGDGDIAGTSFRGASAVIGENVTVVVKGGYHDVDVRAQSMTVGKNLKVTGPAHGGFGLFSGSDLTVSNMSVKLGYIYVWSGTQGTKSRLKVVDSTLQQTYRNGVLWMQATSDDASYYPDAVVLERTTITHKGDDVRIYPNPVIR